MPLPEKTNATASPEKEGVLDRIKRIVETLQSCRVDGMTVDVLTAQTVVRAYDVLSPRKKEKFARLSVKRMICKAFEIAESGQ